MEQSPDPGRFRVLLDQLLADDPDLRRALELKDQGYTLDEIAKIMHTSKPKLKSRIWRLGKSVRTGGRVRG